MAFLEIRDLEKVYPTGEAALKGVDREVGHHAAEPGGEGHLARVRRLVPEADERLLDDLLRPVAVPADPRAQGDETGARLLHPRPELGF